MASNAVANSPQKELSVSPVSSERHKQLRDIQHARLHPPSLQAHFEPSSPKTHVPSDTVLITARGNPLQADLVSVYNLLHQPISSGLQATGINTYFRPLFVESCTSLAKMLFVKLSWIHASNIPPEIIFYSPQFPSFGDMAMAIYCYDQMMEQTYRPRLKEVRFSENHVEEERQFSAFILHLLTSKAITSDYLEYPVELLSIYAGKQSNCDVLADYIIKFAPSAHCVSLLDVLISSQPSATVPRAFILESAMHEGNIAVLRYLYRRLFRNDLEFLTMLMSILSSTELTLFKPIYENIILPISNAPNEQIVEDKSWNIVRFMLLNEVRLGNLAWLLNRIGTTVSGFRIESMVKDAITSQNVDALEFILLKYDPSLDMSNWNPQNILRSQLSGPCFLHFTDLVRLLGQIQYTTLSPTGYWMFPLQPELFRRYGIAMQVALLKKMYDAQWTFALSRLYNSVESIGEVLNKMNRLDSEIVPSSLKREFSLAMSELISSDETAISHFWADALMMTIP
jgi:hypothetical protein